MKSHSVEGAPTHRLAARLLPVNAHGQVLLLLGRDPARPDHLHWVSVGGAVDAGESLRTAAVREMAEETGVEVAEEALVGPLRRVTHPFSWNGADYVSDNHFFAVRLDRPVDVRFDGLEDAEIGNILQARWWTPEALAAEGTAVTDDLPGIMATAIDAVGGAQ